MKNNDKTNMHLNHTILAVSMCHNRNTHFYDNEWHLIKIKHKCDKVEDNNYKCCDNADENTVTMTTLEMRNEWLCIDMKTHA